MTSGEPSRYVTTCYGKPFAEYGSYRVAKAVLAHHIWSCPEGPMPWARPIRWHRVFTLNPVTGARSGPYWMTSSRGGWLSHGIRVRQTWTS